MLVQQKKGGEKGAVTECSIEWKKEKEKGGGALERVGRHPIIETEADADNVSLFIDRGSAEVLY